MTIAVRRICDHIQSACLHLWMLVQGGSGATRLSDELVSASQSRDGFAKSTGNTRSLAESTVEVH